MSHNLLQAKAELIDTRFGIDENDTHADPDDHHEVVLPGEPGSRAMSLVVAGRTSEL